MVCWPVMSWMIDIFACHEILVGPPQGTLTDRRQAKAIVRSGGGRADDDLSAGSWIGVTLSGVELRPGVLSDNRGILDSKGPRA